MQKNHSPDSSLYWYLVSEMEWYGATQDARTELVADCKREAEEKGARYANIMVQPDAVMSISPNPRRHIVWRASADTTFDLGTALTDLCERAMKAGTSKFEVSETLLAIAAGYEQ